MTKTTNKILVKVEFRKELGKKNKRLRRNGFIPANVYGQGQKSTPITLKLNEFQRLLSRHGGELGLVYLEAENKKQPALVTEVSRNPVTDELVHVEFMRVNLKEAVETEVPLEVVGEVDVPDTILEVIRDEIKIKALPEDIPDKIEVNVSGLTEAGQIITIADLNFDKEKITLLVEPEDMDKPVVVLQEVKEEQEPESTEEVETTEEGGGDDVTGEKEVESSKETTTENQN